MRVASGGRAALLRPGLLRALVLGASSWRLARVAQDREHGAASARHPAACRCQDWVASLCLRTARLHGGRSCGTRKLEVERVLRPAICNCGTQLRRRQLGKLPW